MIQNDNGTEGMPKIRQAEDSNIRLLVLRWGLLRPESSALSGYCLVIALFICLPCFFRRIQAKFAINGFNLLFS